MAEEAKGDDAYIKTQFLERLAHELRGPAGVIHGALQELQSSAGQQPPVQETFIAMAQRGLRRILKTADRLQATGQLGRGLPTLDRTECDLRELLEQSVADAHAIEGRRKIQVDLDLPSQPCVAVVDAHWLSIACFELASNAIRHASARVWVALRPSGEGAYELSFTDDGKPASEFGPLRFRAPPDRRGLGLGLAMVHDIARAHGAAVHTAYGKPDGSGGFGARVALTIQK